MTSAPAPNELSVMYDAIHRFFPAKRRLGGAGGISVNVIASPSILKTDSGLPPLPVRYTSCPPELFKPTAIVVPSSEREGVFTQATAGKVIPRSVDRAMQ